MVGKISSAKNFNFKKFVSSLGIDAFVMDNSILPCHCAGLCFIVKDYERILVGDLRIINNNQMKRLLKKVLNYTGNMSVNFKEKLGLI